MISSSEEEEQVPKLGDDDLSNNSMFGGGDVVEVEDNNDNIDDFNPKTYSCSLCSFTGKQKASLEWHTNVRKIPNYIK